MSGFVYIMSNPSYPEGLIKIGKSDKDPHFRAVELKSTGVPTDFKVEYYAFVEDPIQIESKVHSFLKHCRRSEDREFFQCSIPKAILSIRECTSEIKYEGIFYISPEEIQREKEKSYRLEKEKEEAHRRKIEEEKRIAKQLEEERKLEEREKIRYEEEKQIGLNLGALYDRSIGYITNRPSSMAGHVGDLLNGSINYFSFYHFAIEGRYKAATREFEGEFRRFWKARMELYKEKRLRGDFEDKEVVKDQYGRYMGLKSPELYRFLESCESEAKDVATAIKRKHKIPNRMVRMKW